MDDIMNQLNQLIKQIGTRNLVIAAIIIVVIVIIYIVIRALRLKVYRKQIVEIENKMNAIKSLPLQYRLGRVQSISKNVPEVADAYEEYASEYEKISDFQKNELAILVNEVDEQLFYGKLRRVSKKMGRLDEMIQSYEKDSQSLLAKIEKITEIENIQRIEIIRVKEKYRKTIDNFESIRFNVEDFVPHLLDVFNDVDDSFVKLEDMMNNQRFDDAKEFTITIDKKIEWLDDIIENIPGYLAVVRQYVPKKIEKIQSLIDIMPSDRFSLNQLNVDERFQSIKDDLDEIVIYIKQIQLDGISEDLEKLVDDIDGLSNDLEKEKEAYDVFKQKWDDCYTYITHIYDQYKEALLDFNKIKNLYRIDEIDIVIDEKYQDFDVILRESYALEEEMKKGEFSYINMIESVEALKEKSLVHQDYLNEFFSIRDNLYLQEQRAINELENINIVLLEIKSEIKNRHLPMINESYKDYIQDSYDKAAQIQAFRQNRPVELSELSQKVDDARDIIYKLYDNVHNLIAVSYTHLICREIISRFRRY